jgi:hypothetical protein
MDRAVEAAVSEQLASGEGARRRGPFWETDSEPDPGTGPQMDVASLIAGRFPDPVMSALVTRLLEGSKDRAAPADPHGACERALERARQANRKLRDLLEPANQMVVYIGGLFGACQRCWGLNGACPRCGGEGKPGWTDPSGEELLAWVEPALRRLGLAVAAPKEPDELVAAGGSREGKES